MRESKRHVPLVALSDYEALRAENERLRDALEEIASDDEYGDYEGVVQFARNALAFHFDNPTVAEVVEKAKRGEIADNPPKTGRGPQELSLFLSSSELREKATSIEKVSVTTQSRALKADYTREIVQEFTQDLKTLYPDLAKDGLEALRAELIKSRNYWSEHCSDLIQRNAELVKALEDIGRQKKTDELETEYDVEIADFEGGYDACIDTARAALEGQSNEA